MMEDDTTDDEVIQRSQAINKIREDLSNTATRRKNAGADQRSSMRNNTSPSIIGAKFHVEKSENVIFIGDMQTTGYSRLILHNDTKLKMSYKVKCTFPRNYGASPHIGYIKPCCEQMVNILYKPLDDEVAQDGEHRILLQAVAVQSTDKDPKMVWKNPGALDKKTVRVEVEFLNNLRTDGQRKSDVYTTEIYIRAGNEGTGGDGEALDQMACGATSTTRVRGGDNDELNDGEECDENCMKKRIGGKNKSNADGSNYEGQLSTALRLQGILVFLVFILALVCTILLFRMNKKTDEQFQHLDNHFRHRSKKF